MQTTCQTTTGWRVAATGAFLGQIVLVLLLLILPHPLSALLSPPVVPVSPSLAPLSPMPAPASLLVPPGPLPLPLHLACAAAHRLPLLRHCVPLGPGRELSLRFMIKMRTRRAAVQTRGPAPTNPPPLQTQRIAFAWRQSSGGAMTYAGRSCVSSMLFPVDQQSGRRARYLCSPVVSTMTPTPSITGF